MGRRRDECEGLRAELAAETERRADAEEAVRRFGRTMAAHIEQRAAADRRAREAVERAGRLERRLERLARVCATYRSAESSRVRELRRELRRSENARAALEQRVCDLQRANEVLCSTERYMAGLIRAMSSAAEKKAATW